MTRLAIFDLDGTLVDGTADIARAMNGVLEDLGLPPHPVAAYHRFMGAGLARLAELALGETGRKLRDQAVAELGWRYAASPLDGTRPFAGVPEMLAELSGGGLRLAVLTSKPQPLAQRVVERQLTGIPFAVVRGHRDGAQLKPDPSGVEAILQELGEERCRCALIGDTGVDMTTARRARVAPIGACWGHPRHEELRRCGAVAIVSSPRLLPAHLYAL